MFKYYINNFSVKMKISDNHVHPFYFRLKETDKNNLKFPFYKH